MSESQEFRSREKIYFELFNNLFYLTISTDEGWSVISGSVVTREEKQLKIQFVLNQEFPSTCSCTMDIHQQETRWPALRIYPNFDAWLYPYSWLSLFRLHKITIRCQIENVRNLQLYNELGHIDNSSSFYPFGTNTGKGAWFIAGNYEMAIKETTHMALHIQWSGLPDDPDGLKGYYKEYENRITNCSFRVGAQYLSDYNWHPVPGQPSFYLFSSRRKAPDGTPLPAAPLSESSVLTPINIERMPAVKENEELYDYSIRSRTGFIKLVLQEPGIGFGEKEYYQLFSERMMENTWKKKKASLPQPPVFPVIEKISLDYCSENTIDLCNREKSGELYVHQLHPLGIVPATTFLYSLDTDASLLFAFSEVKGGEILSLFLSFYPVGRATSSTEQPAVTWYWGNGYDWEEISATALLTDSTSNFMTSGGIKIRLPEIIYPEQYDRQNLLWLRAGISKNRHLISGLQSVSVNAAQLIQDMEEEGSELWNGENTPETLLPEKKLPGIEGIYPVTPFYGGIIQEKDIDLQIRVAEYVSHRGRAVLPSDYEQITLQAFPDIVAVKCIPDFDGRQYSKGTIALLIIPDRTETETPESPMATSYMLLKVREEMKKYISGYIKELIVINPVYREIMIRCGLIFRSDISLPVAKARLEKLFHIWIAPGK
ncbi:MAG: hypothetical protein LUH15_08650 [Tannerellaceae bacterium]|nr:hypothetical protein [Tannerellaceae bacterium]